jgi:hypothetical protein
MARVLPIVDKLMKVMINSNKSNTYLEKENKFKSVYTQDPFSFCLVLGIFHVYDGVVREHPDKKSKNFLVHLKDAFFEKIGIDEYRKVLMKDAEIAVLALHPKWQLLGKNSDGINGEEMLNHVRYIITGVRRVYVQTAGLWYSGSDFDKIVAGVSTIKAS